MRQRSATDWLQMIRESSDDLVVARLFFANLVGYQGKAYRSDLEQMINLMTALRLDQVRKGGAA